MPKNRLLLRVVSLAALALSDVLQTLDLTPQIKWPNDILLSGRKLAGILIEASWFEHELQSIVIGMGANISKAAVPATDILGFPATSLENVLGYVPDREVILHGILTNIIALRPHVGSDAFMSSWEKKLAYYGRQVRVEMGAEKSVSGKVKDQDCISKEEFDETYECAAQVSRLVKGSIDNLTKQIAARPATAARVARPHNVLSYIRTLVRFRAQRGLHERSHTFP